MSAVPTLSAAAAAPNPAHAGAVAAPVRWTTTNAGEALPGVVTPLTWSFFGDRTERAFREAFELMGVLRAGEVAPPSEPERRLWTVFYGRATGCVDTFRAIADRTPGTGANAVEEQLFGDVRPGMADRPDRSRYPVIAVRLPVAAWRLPAELRRKAAGITPWWQQTVGAPLEDAVIARAAVREAARRFAEVMRPHTLAAMVCQGLYEQIRALAERAGRPGLEIHLVTGYGDMAETDVVSDLWAVSRERLSIDEFVRRHGFHGPNEGELSARTWRINREPLLRLLDAYRAMPDDRDPRLVEARRGEERREAEAELLAALPRGRRAPARLVLRAGARYIPLRGVGKAAFLRCTDVARASARSIGAGLAADGLLEDPEDVFMLTLDELLAARPPDGLAAAAAQRRAVHEEYRALEVPEAWDGVCIPLVPAAPAEDRDGADVTGLAVSPGVVEGVARVISDPEGDDELEPGEILVCRTTDPSWASLMMVAGALVIDIGGAISHGAIVARELGIPCVIGTRTGSQVIRTGDRIRVDGASGRVEVLTRA